MAEEFQYIKLPDGSYGKFSATASDADIRAAIVKDFPNAFGPTTANLGGADMIRALTQKALAESGNRGVNVKTQTAPKAPTVPYSDPVNSALINVMTKTANLPGALLRGSVPVQSAEKVYQGVQDLNEWRNGTPLSVIASRRQENPIDAITGAFGIDRKEVAEDSSTGNYGAVAGDTVFPVLMTLLGGKVAKRSGVTSQNKIPSPVDPTFELTKGVGPDVAGWDSLQNAIGKSHGDVVKFAQENKLPLNNRTDYVAAARAYGENQKQFYRNNVIEPIKNEAVTVPDGYSGQTEGMVPGSNRATIEQLENRLEQINREQANMRNTPTEARSRQGLSRQEELTQEANGIRRVLNSEIGSRTGLTPEQVSDLRQRSGAPFTIADQTWLAVKNEATKGIRQSRGTTTLPDGRVDIFNRMLNAARGGAVKIGDKQFMDAVRKYPMDASPDINVTQSTPAPFTRKPLWQMSESELKQYINEQANPDIEIVDDASIENNASGQGADSLEALRKSALDKSNGVKYRAIRGSNPYKPLAQREVIGLRPEDNRLNPGEVLYKVYPDGRLERM